MVELNSGDHPDARMFGRFQARDCSLPWLEIVLSNSGQWHGRILQVLKYCGQKQVMGAVSL